MMADFAKELWRVYPKCRLHVEVEESGVNSYQVIVKLLDSEKKTLFTVEYFGTGDLFAVKQEAIERMMRLALSEPKSAEAQILESARIRI